MSRILLIAAFAFGFSACDSSIDNTFREQVVVESYQFVGDPLAGVVLYTNAPIDGVFDRTALAITDATVRVALLAEDGSVEAVYPYDANPLIVGGYVPEGAAPTVLPLRRYRLEAEIPGRETVSSETLTPGAFELTNTSAREATWGAEEIVFTVTRSTYPTRQAVFLFTTETQRAQLSTRSRDAVSSEPSSVIQDDDEEEVRSSPEDLRIGSSPLLNEEGYVLNRRRHGTRRFAVDRRSVLRS